MNLIQTTGYNSAQDTLKKYGSEDLKQTISVLTQKLRQHPTAEDYNDRGVVAYNLGLENLAFGDFSRSIYLNPDYSIPYLNRAGLRCVKVRNVLNSVELMMCKPDKNQEQIRYFLDKIEQMIHYGYVDLGMYDDLKSLRSTLNLPVPEGLLLKPRLN